MYRKPLFSLSILLTITTFFMISCEDNGEDNTNPGANGFVSVGGTYQISERMQTTYNSSSGFGDCNLERDIFYYQPQEEGKYPLFIMTHGSFHAPDHELALTILQEAASAGYVAASVGYPNNVFDGWLCDHFQQKAYCIYTDELPGPNKKSAVEALCNDNNIMADCSLGIVTGGPSQGAMMSILSGNFSNNVRAAYAMSISDYLYGLPIQIDGFLDFIDLFIDIDLSECLDAANRSLPSDRLLVITGESDKVFSDAEMLCAPNETTCEANHEQLWNDIGRLFFDTEQELNMNCLYSSSRQECIYNTDTSSGWYIISDEEVAEEAAFHAYQLMLSGETEPTWYNPDAMFNWDSQPEHPWSLITGFKFLDQFTEAPYSLP